MRFASFARIFHACLLALLFTATSVAALAQAPSNDSNSSQGALFKAVRESTAKFQDVNAAMAASYQLTFGCVTGPDSGAMGLHYVNFDLFTRGVLDPAQPTILIYEPQPDGSQKLTGADFLILKSKWEADHPNVLGGPQLLGQIFQFFDAPNRFGLPPFYTLHVWAWKENPNGAFVNWHPHVSCKSFSDKSNF